MIKPQPYIPDDAAIFPPMTDEQKLQYNKFIQWLMADGLFATETVGRLKIVQEWCKTH